MVYTCEHCGYTTDRIFNFKKHQNRKSSCNLKIWKYSTTTFVDPNVDPCYKNVDPCAQNVDPSAQNVDPCAQNVDPCYKNVDPENKPVKQIKCSYCSKCFTSRQGKYKHLKNTECKRISHIHVINNKSEIINQNVIITNLNINNTQNNTIHNHKTSNYFGNEDFSYLGNDNYIMDTLNQNSKNKVYGFVNILMSMLFDPNRPENHNIIKTTERGTDVKIRNKNNEWEYRDFGDVKEYLAHYMSTFMQFYNIFKTKHNIKLTEKKELKRVRMFVKLIRKLGCRLDDDLEIDFGIYDGSDSDDSDDEEKNENELKRLNKIFDKATLNNIYLNTKRLFKMNLL